ncbi:hypothetical protein CH63R_11529 [Colletotrichum higginsianum IMI 349063]|uniref:Uncharacterized protein n=1 Tax=Colletotrichum higginsianum (strain IMI 349063) TaxID=759273 RepID=A0A1B7XYI7_COLHI|nr:hypothetical protein CH63R_11529 [Colletotrichum higginsianum IMI 349063]OBR04826.1 hypothetical protein CH63R_11529 [Colletotrichum higginsianum IMI 349063]
MSPSRVSLHSKLSGPVPETIQVGPVIGNPRKLVRCHPQAEYCARWERGKSVLSQKAHELSPEVQVHPLAPQRRCERFAYDLAGIRDAGRDDLVLTDGVINVVFVLNPVSDDFDLLINAAHDLYRSIGEVSPVQYSLP